jgi:hypothetical protein
MYPTTLSDRTLLARWITQDMQGNLAESRALSRQICDEATAARATSAVLMQVTAQLRHHAQQVRAVHAQHLAAGVHRRQNGTQVCPGVLSCLAPTTHQPA